MQKNRNFFSVTTLVYMALFTALQIVLTRVLVIDLGSYRITLGHIATIMAGLWLGPLPGALVGLVSDILGCFLRGYAVNPFITVAGILWGVLPALARPWMAKYTRKGKTAVICISVALTSVISMLVLTTAGLVLLLGYNFYAIMPGRLVQFAMLTPIYCVLTCLLYFSPLTAMVTGRNASAGSGFQKKPV